MALKNRSDAKVTYLKIKDGKFYLSTDKENKNPFDSVDGMLTDIFFKDETYEGNTIKKLYVVLTDGDEKSLIGFSFDSSYTTTLIGFLMNADLTKRVELSPLEKTIQKDGKDVKRRSILVSQDGTYLKGYFTQATPNGLPPMKKVKFNGKELWDKTDFLAFYEKTINETIKPKLTGTTSQDTPTPSTSDSPSVGKLPWEEDELPF